jgi:DNA helicase-2/ATP-dependent DNA helicase PcrA
MMPLSLDDLNQNQMEAVLWNEGPLLVLAGPGSGKTKVLATRVVRLLERERETSVLALTFTNKAASEMRNRVDQLFGQRANRAHLCTFHSFASDIIRQHGSHVGIGSDFTLLTQDEDRIAILEPIATRLRSKGYTIPLDCKTILPLIDRLFAESFGINSEANSVPYLNEWIPLIFEEYLEALAKSNKLDFGSLLHFSCKLIQNNSGVIRLLRMAWPFVCVDEFQDTNRAQYDLLKLLVGDKTPNLFVVADDDQIIYQWNGASPERLRALTEDYKMKIVQLPENYRCPPQIIEIANNLIEHNHNRTTGKQRLTSHKKAISNNKVIRYKKYRTLEDESMGLAGEIIERKLDYSKCAVLARATYLLPPVVHALNKVGIDAFLAQQKNDFDSPAIRVLFLSLRLADARHDREILRKLCVAWEQLTGVTIDMVNVVTAATLIGGDFLRAWGQAVETNYADKGTSSLRTHIDTDLINRLNYLKIIGWFLADGWKNWEITGTREINIEISTWYELHQEILNEYGSDDISLNVYLQQIDLRSKAPRPPPGSVRCMTVHGSKGLEFEHVFLIGMGQEVFPSYRAIKKGSESREMEEERRNCFVAITRAEESLTLSRAQSYNGWNKEPSQFLMEMGIEETPES